MPPHPRAGRAAPHQESAGRLGLTVLGLAVGEAVRWRPTERARWRTGVVTHRERDGSVGVRDTDGAARSLAVERLEVHRRGPKGGRGWEALTVRAGRAEQLRLLP